MNMPLKITRVGNSAGIVLPKAILAHLEAGVGDGLILMRTSRSIELAEMKSPDIDIADQMAAAQEVMQRRHRAMMALAERIMAEDRDILAALAKSQPGK